jgi:hypothetical protein
MIWLVCFLACVFYALFAVTNSIRKYSKYETVVTTKVLRETPTIFPAVTICNLNPFNELYAYTQMSDVAKDFSETNNCIARKTYLMQQIMTNLYNILSQLNLTNTDACIYNESGQQITNENHNDTAPIDNSNTAVSNTTSTSIVTTQIVTTTPSYLNNNDYIIITFKHVSSYVNSISNSESSCNSSMIYDELSQIVFNLNWTTFFQWNLTVSQAFDSLGWQNSGWFRALINQYWADMSIKTWFSLYSVDFSVLVNSASNLKDCLKIFSPDDIDSVLDKIKRNFANQYSFTNQSFLSNMGFDLQCDMFQSCQFNGNNTCFSNFDLDHCIYANYSSSIKPTFYNGLFTAFWNNRYGMCYTFNGYNADGFLQTSQSGPDYGLKMSLNVGKSQNFQIISPTANGFPLLIQDAPIETYFSYRNGIYLLVHNQSRSLESLSGGIYLSPGSETYIAVSRTFFLKEQAPFSNCISTLKPFSAYSQTLFGYFAKINAINYDQQLCIDFCYQDKLILSCNCSSLIVQALNNTRYCESDDEVLCEQGFDSVFSSSNPDLFCEDVCRPECETLVFDTSISLSKFPTQDYINAHPYQNVSLRFVLNYKDTTYTQISESPAVTFEFLLGDVGGQLNLFVGLSFLTLLEVMELAFEILIWFYKIKIKKNSVSFDENI